MEKDLTNRHLATGLPVHHIAVIRAALRQLPADNTRGHRCGRSVLVRIDGAGSTHELLDWLTARNLSYSVGFALPDHTPDLLAKIPTAAWSSALDADGKVRDGAWVAELTGLLDLTRWPTGMRVIARVERPHPGAQLRITDADGNRVTAPTSLRAATNTRPGGPAAQIADLELRHRRRARCEDRIRNAKDTGLANLPLHDLAQNRIWCAVVMLACELLVWTQMLAYPTHPARRWEPKRLRLRLFSIAGRLARHAAPPRRRPPLDRRAAHRPSGDHRGGPTRLNREHRLFPRPSTPAGPWTRPLRPHGGHLVMPTRHNHPPTLATEPETITNDLPMKDPG